LVVWTESARASLRQIHDFIALDSHYYAKEVVDNLVDLAERIVELPSRGRVVPERNDPTLREVILYSYRIIYRVTDDGIVIMAVLHGRRLFPEDLA